MKVRASVEFDLEVETEINDYTKNRQKALQDLENEVVAKLPFKVDFPFRYEQATGDPMLVLIQKIDNEGFFEEILLDY